MLIVCVCCHGPPNPGLGAIRRSGDVTGGGVFGVCILSVAEAPIDRYEFFHRRSAAWRRPEFHIEISPPRLTWW
jgi:hypothetical protein